MKKKKHHSYQTMLWFAETCMVKLLLEKTKRPMLTPDEHKEIKDILKNYEIKKPLK